MMPRFNNPVLNVNPLHSSAQLLQRCHKCHLAPGQVRIAAMEDKHLESPDELAINPATAASDQVRCDCDGDRILLRRCPDCDGFMRGLGHISGWIVPDAALVRRIEICAVVVCRRSQRVRIPVGGEDELTALIAGREGEAHVRRREFERARRSESQGVVQALAAKAQLDILAVVT